jgi:hypothetical protein
MVHFPAPHKLLGFIPWSRWQSWTGVPRADVLDLIRFFFDGKHDRMLQKLATATTVHGR